MRNLVTTMFRQHSAFVVERTTLQDTQQAHRAPHEHIYIYIKRERERERERERTREHKRTPLTAFKRTALTHKRAPLLIHRAGYV